MESPLAFDRDPLFGKLSEPLIKIDTRLTQTRQRFWIWKTDDFFWFWNEDEPDFFGVFLEGKPKSKLSFSGEGTWFEEAMHGPLDELKRILRQQLHDRNWARALPFTDPRPEKVGVWRVLWQRREFLLQSAVTGRAVRFFPETNWPKVSWQWDELNPFSHDAAFFADMLWPVLTERHGRLKTALEFLELSVNDQENPIRFGHGTCNEFSAVLRAAMIVNYSWPDGIFRSLSVRFLPRAFQPIFDVSVKQQLTSPTPHIRNSREILNSRLERLAVTFSPHLSLGFTFHSVAPAPLMMPSSIEEHSLKIQVQGPFTGHERMEAILMVRDWLTKKAPELLVDWL